VIFDDFSKICPENLTIITGTSHKGGLG